MSAEWQLALSGWVIVVITVGSYLFQAGALREQLRNLKAAIVAIHRRLDEIHMNNQEVREVMIARGYIDAGTSPGRRNPLLDKED